ncbi:MAG: hypothetical protein KTR31_11905 [Myxococcales bacterium]|nr:hypothetical protein [Myxococcales bacterium]
MTDDAVDHEIRDAYEAMTLREELLEELIEQASPPRRWGGLERWTLAAAAVAVLALAAQPLLPTGEHPASEPSRIEDLIPAGMRAVTLQPEPWTLAAPPRRGDRVDLMTTTLDPIEKRVVTRTIAKQLQVLAEHPQHLTVAMDPQWAEWLVEQVDTATISIAVVDGDARRVTLPADAGEVAPCDSAHLILRPTGRDATLAVLPDVLLLARPTPQTVTLSTTPREAERAIHAAHSGTLWLERP